jgi:S1-C subfamily serine protease
LKWFDLGYRDETNTGRYAPDMQYAAQKGIEATVFIVTLTQTDTVRDTAPDSIKRGSGVIISPDGYIVTNSHVVSDASRIIVTIHARHVFNAEIVALDFKYDIGLIKIKGKNLPYLAFGDSWSLKHGESVIAIGNPYELHATITSGIVSALNRDLDNPLNATPNLIQTDVPINTGNSGGPLLNARGEMMGIMTMLMSVSGVYEGYSFAIPSGLVEKIATDLRHYGERRPASLKMRIRPVTYEIAAYAKMHKITGVVVDAVDEGGAADVSGLKSLDIILTANGREVESVPMFLGMLSLTSPGDTLNLFINRDGTEMGIDVVMEELEEERE